MTFYVYPIEDEDTPLTERLANLDKARQAILDVTPCQFSKRMYPRTRSASDQYTTTVSGFAFIDYLDDVIAPLARQHVLVALMYNHAAAGRTASHRA